MESKLQRILEVLRLTPSKEKSFERESDGSPSMEKKQNILARFKNANDNSIITGNASRDGNIEKRHVRKYGVPCKFYPRSHSLETQPAEKNFDVDSTKRFALRRNSSLDSDTERFCMRYEGADKSASEFDEFWWFPGRETSMARSNEDFNERKLKEKRMMNTINCRSQELFNTESCYKTTETDGCEDDYEDDYESEWKEPMPTDSLIPKITSNTCLALRNLDCNQLRSMGENQGQAAQGNTYRVFKEITEDHLQEDISSYERWIAKSKFTGQMDATVKGGTMDHYSHSSSGLETEKQDFRARDIVNICGNITDERTNEQRTETFDDLNMRETSARRYPSCLRRQDGIDALYDANAARHGFYAARIEDPRKSTQENAVSLSGNAASLSRNKAIGREIQQDHVGKCEIRILDPFPEINDRDENLAYPQYENGSGILGSELISTDYQEPNLIDDSYASYAMEKDFRFMHGKTSRRSMKLRRDSPFAFPLIEEFARSSNSFSDGYHKNPVKSSMQGSHFSGSIGYFLESQKIGDKVTK